MKKNSVSCSDNPGPNEYAVKPLLGGYKHHVSCASQNSAYSFNDKHKSRDVSDTPGPQYAVYNLTRHGKTSGPKFSLGSKLEQGSWNKSQKFQTPGPGTYSPDDNLTIKWKRAPSFSIGHRMKEQQEKVGPGPNCYLPIYVSGKQSNLGFSLGLVLPQNKAFQTPGPGTYDVSDLEAYKTRQPRIKMVPIMTEQVIKKKPEVNLPGPNAYLPSLNTIRRNGPKFSFGLRHSTKSLM